MFNVGDRVRVNIADLPGPIQVGTVKEVQPGTNLPYQVFIEGHSDGPAGTVANALFGTSNFPFNEEELVFFVEGAPRFNVGDRVSIDEKLAGPKFGTVREVKASPNTYEVWVDDDSDGWIGDELEALFGKRTVDLKEYYLTGI
jgi:hypothetical protein